MNKDQQEQAIEKAALASQFEQSEVGQFVIEYLAKQITVGTNDVMGRKFNDNREEELFTKGEVNMARKLLRMLQVTKEAGVRAKKELGDD